MDDALTPQAGGAGLGWSGWIGWGEKAERKREDKGQPLPQKGNPVAKLWDVYININPTRYQHVSVIYQYIISIYQYQYQYI